MSLNSRRVCKTALSRGAVIPSPWETGAGRLKFRIRGKKVPRNGWRGGGSAEKNVYHSHRNPGSVPSTYTAA